jgi:ABC-type transport system involved in multi-copper enzyme maturation permease subunit
VIGQTRAEFLKIRSTRTTLGLVLGMVALVMLVALLHGLLSKVGSLDEKGDQRDLLGTGGFASLFSVLAGVLVVTSEYRFGTIRPTFLFSPRRSRVIEAKLAASMLTGVGFAVVGEVLAVGIGFAILAGRGIPVSLEGSDLVILVLRVLADAALWGGLGVGVATIIRNQIGSVIALLAWLFVVESVLFGFVPSVGRFTPGQASEAFNGSTKDHLLPPAAGVAVLAAWVAVLVASGIALTARRDVN